MKLMTPLNIRSGVPMHEQAYSYMREEIRKGNLEAAIRLPSARVPAESLKVSRNTTQMAYERLVSEGYIEAVPRKGYCVTRTEESVEAKQAIGEDFRIGLEVVPHEHYQVDFSPRGIDLGHFPHNAWRKVTKDTLVDDSKELFLTGNPQEEVALWGTTRGYLHSVRGVNCDREQTIVGAGSECLLVLLSRILGTEHVIIMESSTYKQAYLALGSLGYLAVPMEMDRYRLSAKLLEESGADITYVVSSHQYPTGIVIPVKRRQGLLNWMRKSPSRYPIKGDYDNESRYKGKPIPAPQGVDNVGKIIYIEIFSKSITPTIRVSYMALPAPLMENYQKKVGFYASTVFRTGQNILYQFLMDGYYERHLNRMRAIYKAKHDTLMVILKGLETEFLVKGEHAGLHVLPTYRKGRPESWLVKRAKKPEMKVYGLSSYSIHPQHSMHLPTVVPGYTNLDMEEVERGVVLLKDTWGEEPGDSTIK